MVASSIEGARSFMISTLALVRSPAIVLVGVFLMDIVLLMLLPRAFGIEAYSQPPRVRGVLEVPREVGKLFDLGGQHRRFYAAMFTVGDGTQHLCLLPALGYRGVQDFAIADQLRGKSSRAAALAGR